MARIRQITSPEGLSPAQKAVYDSIAGGARGGVRGPHSILLHNPMVADPVDKLGVFVRYECSVPERQRELTIVVVAAHWRADYEWFAHAPLAQKQGIGDGVIHAIGRRETPEFETDADRVVHAFARQVLETGRADDAVYHAAVDLLGEGGTLDLTALIGYYTFIALTLNVFEVEPGAGTPIPWR